MTVSTVTCDHRHLGSYILMVGKINILRVYFLSCIIPDRSCINSSLLTRGQSLTSSREEVWKHCDLAADCDIHLHNGDVADVMHLGMKFRMLVHHQHNQPLQRHNQRI